MPIFIFYITLLICSLSIATSATALSARELMQKVDILDEFKDEEIVVICHSGSRSMMASQLLVRAGFKDVRNLTGGMMLWHRRGYPV